METKRKNPWISHLNKFRADHPELKGSDVIKEALATYEKVTPQKKKANTDKAPKKKEKTERKARKSKKKSEEIEDEENEKY